jgi:ATP-dependent RNA helicase DDX19/DBP5
MSEEESKTTNSDAAAAAVKKDPNTSESETKSAPTSESESDAAASSVRMKAHVVLEKVKTADLAKQEEEAKKEEDAANKAVQEATQKAEETAAAAAASAEAAKKREEEEVAEAKLKKEKEIEDKKKESSEELTKRLQKLALERQKENRHDRLKVIQSDQTSHLSSAKTFQDLNLPDYLLKAIFEMGFERPSAIQEEALPRILANPPRNVIGQAQSGSGKTAAFVVGMLFRVVIDTPATCQGLCVTPTRELAVQIFQNAVTPMAAHMKGLKVRLALAGEQIARGTKLDAHIVIGTPGKVVDWLKRRIIDTKKIKVFVLDEADNMVAESGHRANSLLIKKQMPKTCQSLLFSATFPPEVIAFAEKMVYNPDKILIESGPEFLVSIFVFCLYK